MICSRISIRERACPLEEYFTTEYFDKNAIRRLRQFLALPLPVCVLEIG